MTYPTIKMKISPRPIIKGKMDVRFPANVAVLSPIVLDRSNGVYTFSFDADALSANYASAAQGAKADSALQSVVAGTNVSVDNTDPRNPIVSAIGSGSGDVTGPSSSVDGEIALFNSTTGKVIKRASTTGVLKASAGVVSAATAGTSRTHRDRWCSRRHSACLSLPAGRQRSARRCRHLSLPQPAA